MFVFYLILILATLRQSSGQIDQKKDVPSYFPLDTISSTLGEYYMVFKSSCVFEIYQVSDNGTKNKIGQLWGDNWKEEYGECKKSYINNKLRSIEVNTTNLGIVPFLQIQTKSNVDCFEMLFTIDDEATVRLTCIPESSQEYIERIWHNFTKYSKNRRCFSQINITSSNSTQIYKNQGGWNIWVDKGKLGMNHANPNKNASYYFGELLLLPQKLRGNNGREWPNMETPRVDFRARCNSLKGNKLYTPFVFEFNDKYPLLEIMDYTGYVILSLQYPFFQCGRDLYEVNSFYSNCHSPVCPPEMFLHGTLCVFECPLSHHHSIRQGLVNRCVLKCPEDAKSGNFRTCSCNDMTISCPNFTIPYPNSCKCLSGFYIYELCLQKCPPQYFGYENVCISCPKYCNKCSLSTHNASFLQCDECLSNYKLQQYHCVSKCSLLKTSTNWTDCPKKCKDPHCIQCLQNCQTDANCTSGCLACTPFHILVTMVVSVKCNPQTDRGCNPNGIINITTYVCNATKDKSIRLLYNKYGKFTSKQQQNSSFNCSTWAVAYVESNGYIVCTECPRNLLMFGQNCLQSCQDKWLFEQNGVCKCTQRNILIVSECRLKRLCPIGMYLNKTLQTCMQCDFGCISCIPIYNKTYCTSCSPGYILFITNEAITCNLNSILQKCPPNTKFERSACIPNSIEYNGISTYSPFTRCKVNDLNCDICLADSLYVCLVCRQYFYLLVDITNNDRPTNCVSQCPNETMGYNGVCVLKNHLAANQEICTNYVIKNIYNYGFLNLAITRQKNTYGYYANNLKERSFNNIVGYLVEALKLNGFHISKISQAGIFCQKCIDGYGLNRTLGKCQPCPDGCETCLSPAADSCLKCLQPAFQRSNWTCVKKYEMCTNQLLFRKNDYKCSQSCDFFFVDNPQGVNCTDSCQEGTFPTLSNNHANYKTNGRALMMCAEMNVLPKSMVRETPYIPIYGSLFIRKDNRPSIIIVPQSQFRIKKVPQPSPKIYYYEPQNGRVVDSRRFSPSHFRSSFIYYFSNFSGMDLQYVRFYVENKAIKSLSDNHGRFLASSLYGIKPHRDFNKHIRKDIFYFGVICSTLTIIVHIISIANYVPFRAENCIILLQTVGLLFYMRFPVKLQLLTFYNGFTSINIRFMLNFFSDCVPHSYLEQSPIMFKLANLDCNFVRNTGEIFTYLIIMVALWIVVASFMYLLSKKGGIRFARQVIDYLFSILSFPLLIINYFVWLQLTYGRHLIVIQSSDMANVRTFNGKSVIVSMIPLVLSFLFVIGCWFRSRMLFLYNVKRVMIGVIMALGIQNMHVSRLTIVIELLFGFGRCFVDEPFYARDYWMIILEALMFILVYGMMWSHSSTSIIVVITIIVLINVLMLLYGMGQMLLSARLRRRSQLHRLQKQTTFQ